MVSTILYLCGKESVILTLENEITIGDLEIVKIVEKRDYFKNKFGMLLLTLTLDVTKYSQVFKLFKGKSFINCHFTEEQILPQSGDESHESDVIEFRSLNYICMVDRGRTHIDDDFLEYMKTNNEELPPESLNSSQTFTISLIEENAIKCFTNGVVGGIYKNSNIATLISYGFIKCSLPNMKLFLTKLDNNPSFINKVIQPKGFIEFLSYLNEDYNMFSGLYNVYIERDEVYILNFNNDVGFKYSETSNTGNEWYDEICVDSMNVRLSLPAKSLLTAENDENGRMTLTYHLRDITNLKYLHKMTNVANTVKHFINVDDKKLLGTLGDLSYDRSVEVTSYNKNPNNTIDREFVEIVIEDFVMDIKPITLVKIKLLDYVRVYRVMVYNMERVGVKRISRLILYRVKESE